MQKELSIGFTAPHKIIHEQLHVKKLVCRLVPHDLIEHQKAACVRICKETLKLLNDGDHYFISKFITSDETNIIFDVLTYQESEIWVFEDAPKSIVMKIQPAMEKVTYAIFFSSQSHQAGGTESNHC